MDTNDSLVPGFDTEKDDSIQFSLQKIDAVDNGCLISLYGFVDTYNSTFFQNQITKIITAGYINLIIDCSMVTTIASTGLGVLTNLLKMVRAMGGNIILAEVQENIYDTFELLGFVQFFNIKATVDEAFAYLTGRTKSETVVSFPKIVTCPSCGKNLKAPHAGRFRCLECRSVLVVTDTGLVTKED
ncbi:STAS domain-containing protein [Treponema sp. C6A8]|uniref:STAS domain-containing protein n=1 Tax=Treponema sp. C6A8 TaxID=1410609 RepID=UPI0004800149|nr:STAS domain-containing protein [Treponema sp. C6A8]